MPLKHSLFFSKKKNVRRIYYEILNQVTSSNLDLCRHLLRYCAAEWFKDWYNKWVVDFICCLNDIDNNSSHIIRKVLNSQPNIKCKYVFYQ